MHRRRFLQATGTAAATLATAGVVSADHRATYESQPDYVDLVFDRDALEQYQPYIVTRHLDVKPTATYAWIADSTERDTRMYCYWVYWTTQHGVSPVRQSPARP